MMIIVVMLSGCGISPESTYPDFSRYKLGMTGCALLADCVIIDDMIGDTNRIDIVANKSLGGLLLTHFTDRLIGKGYHVDNTVLTSVGLVMDQRRVYKLARSVRSEDADLTDLPIGLPPFYLNDVFQDSFSETELKSAYNALIKSFPDREGQKIVIPGTVSVGKLAEEPTLMIVFLGGFNVSASKEFNDESASNASTVGQIGMQHISQVTVAFYIVDAKTGELLWSDQHSTKGGTVHKEKIIRLADKIIEDLP